MPNAEPKLQDRPVKEELLGVLCCPDCTGALTHQPEALGCTECGKIVPLIDGKPAFTAPPSGLRPSEKIERSQSTGTPWRQANWRFLEQQLALLPPDALFLDVGAGRGDFAALLQRRRCLALDVYPYPEVDLVCDLTQCVPFRPESLDAILLMNVLEHVYDARALFGALTRLLKPGGRLIAAIPFMIKIHQAPVDYARYTHFALERLGADHGLAVEHLEGYYDPLSLLGEGTGNLKWAVLPALPRPQRYLGRLLLGGIQVLAQAMAPILGKGAVQAPEAVRSAAPIGYQVVYRSANE